MWIKNIFLICAFLIIFYYLCTLNTPIRILFPYFGG